MDDNVDARVEYDAVVLAGGSARRFAGADKVMFAVAGTPMLARVLSAVAGARTTVVVGPERSLAESAGRHVRWTREQPAGSGPLAALAAGLGTGTAPVVVVLAGDMPMVDTAVVAALVEAAAHDDVDGAVLVDGEGRRQPLAAAYVRERLQAAMAAIGDPRDRPMGLLLSSMRLGTVPDPRAALDCDTPDALAHVNELATRERPTDHP
ncbi:MAG TPA: NTP transferase domain-containing protein [Actinopolymorphaceae bacterium]|nr:NTP transferase domain-containing protein [Actinopolymorphaceae bacterium]